VKDIVEMINLLLYVMIITHFMACTFIYLGNLGPAYWIRKNGFDKKSNFSIYVFSFYWIITTLTTVGYGDYTGAEMEEIIFTMILEFIGLTFFHCSQAPSALLQAKKKHSMRSLMSDWTS